MQVQHDMFTGIHRVCTRSTQNITVGLGGLGGGQTQQPAQTFRATLGVSHMKAMSGDNREVACNNLGDDDNDDDQLSIVIIINRETESKNLVRFRLVLILTISDEIVGLLVMVQQPWSVGSVGCCETSTESLISCWLLCSVLLQRQLDLVQRSGR